MRLRGKFSDNIYTRINRHASVCVVPCVTADNKEGKHSKRKTKQLRECMAVIVSYIKTRNKYTPKPKIDKPATQVHTCNACSFLGVQFKPSIAFLATARAMVIAGGALRRRAVGALAYGHAARRTALRAPGPRSIRFSVFALLTRWSLHAAPAIPAMTGAVTKPIILPVFAHVPSSTWNACRYFLSSVGSGVQGPRFAVADAGGRWTSSVTMLHKEGSTGM